MCGRFSLGVDTDRLVAEFGIDLVTTDHEPRYNIAPTQPVPAVVRGDDGLRLGTLRWGLTGDPARGGSGRRPLINARSETVHTRPAFRDAFRRRRCWILADGFYEWRAGDDGSRIPVHFRLPGGEPFAFAGLWNPGYDGAPASGTILTTTPAEAVRPIHDRMPVILPRAARSRWLDPGEDPGEHPEALLDLLRPWSAALEGHQVSTRVNSPSNDDPACVRPLHRTV